MLYDFNSWMAGWHPTKDKNVETKNKLSYPISVNSQIFRLQILDINLKYMLPPQRPECEEG